MTDDEIEELVEKKKPTISGREKENSFGSLQVANNDIESINVA